MRLSAIAIIGAALLTAGCETTPGRERIARLEPGMTKVQVSEQLGAPTDVVRDGTREAWRYCLVGAVVDEYVVAWFDGHELVGSSSKIDHDTGPCRVNMEAFSWDDAPAASS